MACQETPIPHSDHPSTLADQAFQVPDALDPALRDRAEDILFAILAVSSEGVVVLDADRRILVFSEGASAIFGYRPSEVIGRPVEVLVPEDRRAAHVEHVRRFAAGSVDSRRMVGREPVLGRARDGRVVPIEVGMSKLASPKGNLFTAIIRDISHRVETEKLLAQAAEAANAANAAKSAFLATMSHEIRTPLNGVLGMAQAMEQDALSPRQRERLDVVRKSGESLLAILNDLLDLSKIEANKLHLEESDFDLESLVEGARATFAGLAAQKGLAFEARIAEDARGAWRGDPLRIRQILVNLISNAMKFTDAGSVRVRAGRSPGGLVLEVSDTGIGIPPDRRDSLFRKFEQADASSTRRFGGSGLGLAICRELTVMMGGDISVDSRPGQGATFRVELPLARGATRPREDAPPVAATRPAGDGLRVLVAEDNPTNQLVVGTLLGQAGVETVIVGDGQAAVDAWAAGDFDLVLMDVQMPGMDGCTAAGVIRARERADGLPRTPILALTANAMTHQVEEYRQAGMDGHIAKPIEVDRLFLMIEAALADPPGPGRTRPSREPG
ncbi:MAG: ATP-binding protein [Pseudomonadota bacterium]